MNPAEKELWHRIEAAIYATKVNRAAVELNWPECHKPRCNHRHPSPDEAFSLFAERVAETVYTEILCRSTTEPDMGDEASGMNEAQPNIRHECSSQCDHCHTLDNCVGATRRYGDLLLCADCYRARVTA